MNFYGTFKKNQATLQKSKKVSFFTSLSLENELKELKTNNMQREFFFKTYEKQAKLSKPGTKAKCQSHILIQNKGEDKSRTIRSAWSGNQRLFSYKKKNDSISSIDSTQANSLAKREFRTLTPKLVTSSKKTKSSFSQEVNKENTLPPFSYKFSTKHSNQTQIDAQNFQRKQIIGNVCMEQEKKACKLYNEIFRKSSIKETICNDPKILRIRKKVNFLKGIFDYSYPKIMIKKLKLAKINKNVGKTPLFLNKKESLEVTRPKMKHSDDFSQLRVTTI